TYQLFLVFFTSIPPPPSSTLFPYTTLFRSDVDRDPAHDLVGSELNGDHGVDACHQPARHDRDLAWHNPWLATVVAIVAGGLMARSEEHTSELQSRRDLVCRLLLEKKKKKTN